MPNLRHVGEIFHLCSGNACVYSQIKNVVYMWTAIHNIFLGTGANINCELNVKKQIIMEYGRRAADHIAIRIYIYLKAAR